MNLVEAYYEQKFEIEFRRCQGDAFQTFFEDLMKLAYNADFLRCRPWGNNGDRKNDGYLQSERRLFQVYAPNEMTAKKAIEKIQEDFSGAKKHWIKYFDTWVFVHNATDGLPPHVIDTILDLAHKNPKIKLETWGLEEIRLIFRKLSIDHKKSRYGSAPDEETKNHLGFGDLQVVLEKITTGSFMGTSPVQDVPPRKIEANALSDATASLLKQGIIKASLVDKFFSTWHDETLGERLADAFKTEYRRMRNSHDTPNEIFTKLQTWAGGNQRGTPEHELAVITVISYYFERCDIFEKPREIIS